MNAKTAVSLTGLVIALTGLAIVFFWREQLVPLFVPLVSGAFQDQDGKILVTDMSAPGKLMLLTWSAGLAVTALGAVIFALPLLKKRTIPAQRHNDG